MADEDCGFMKIFSFKNYFTRFGYNEPPVLCVR